jgi:ribosomal-protein-serine acetyltransferase
VAAAKPSIPISETARLRLLRERDAGELHALIEANRGRLRRWLPWAARQTIEETLAFLRRAEAQVAANDGFQAALEVKGTIAGVIGFSGVDWEHGNTSLGYWIGAENEGEGLMTESVRALVDHAIQVWGLNRVEIRAAVDNGRSRAIPERLGFREEGTLREAQLVDGRFLDNVVYSMLAADWRQG